MDMTALLTGGSSAITGLITQGGGMTYGIAVFLLIIIGFLIAYKLFHILMKVVTISAISALSPYAINLLTRSLFGFELFIITSNMIVTFMFLGLVGYTVYRIVYFVLNLLEGIVGTGHHAHHHKKKHVEDDEG